MKTILKTLPSDYVNIRSDFLYGITDRNHAVKALKTFIKTVKSNRLKSKINRIPIGKIPQESFMNLMTWMENSYPDLYFIAENDKFYLGYLITEKMKFSILIFPIDFLVKLRKIDWRLEDLILKAIYAFSNYHEIGEPFWGNRVYNEDWIVDSLSESIEYNDPENNIDIKDLLHSYEVDRGNYVSRFVSCYKHKFKPSDILAKLMNYKTIDELQFIIDVFIKMMRLCEGRSIRTYTEKSMEIYTSENEINLNEDGIYLEDDSCPLTLDDRILFTWGGETEHGEDRVLNEIEAVVNAIANEMNVAEFIEHLQINDKLDLEDLIFNYNKDKKFFTDLENVYQEYQEMRKKILFSNLDKQIHEIRQYSIQTKNRIKGISEEVLF